MPQVIPEEELEDQLRKLPDWEIDTGALLRVLEFETYTDGLEYVNEVAEMAEEANHHPDITIGWCKVELRLSTHSKGGITELDLAMAERLDRLDP